MKRLAQWLVALVMVAALCFPTSVIQAVQPADTQTATISVTNGPANGTVTAYPMLAGQYNEYGLVGYMPVNQAAADVFKNTDGITDAAAGTVLSHDDVLKVLNHDTASIISTIRSQITPDYPMTPSTAEPTTFTANVPAGAYVVVVEDPGDSTRVYSVGMVSANWTGSGDDAEITGGSVDLNSKWGTTEQLKSQEVTLDKTMTDLDSDDTENGAAFDQNEAIQFNVSTAVPNYNSTLYKTVTYNISDTFSDGLTLLLDAEHPVTVNVGEQKNVSAGAGTYTLTAQNGGNSLLIEFASDFILQNIGQPVTVSYYGTISGDKFNFDGTTNTAELEYSNNPTDGSDTQKIQDKTYQYSFAIDGTVNGSESAVNGEIVKVNEDFTSSTTKTAISPEVRLQGAEFGIWKGTEAVGDPIQTATSDKNGLLNFKGLDTGEYTIKEIKAPAGYTLNEKPIAVVIAASYNKDGRLNSYTITINGENTNTYTASYTPDGEIEEITPDAGNTPFPIQNTKIPSLPSTGSTGAIVLTAGGAVLMGAAAAYVLGRRRKEQHQR